jgi:hypothetical protein
MLATVVALGLVGCGSTDTETVYVDRNVTVEVPVEKIVEVEVPVDVYVYQNYTSTVNFEDLRVEINCTDGNCTASILEYNCYPSEYSGGPSCNCGFYPIEGYKSVIHCTECCEVCTDIPPEDTCDEEPEPEDTCDEEPEPEDTCDA